jgi:hypothetical protein
MDPLAGARWLGLGLGGSTGAPQSYYPTLFGAMQAPSLQGLVPPLASSQPMVAPRAEVPGLQQYLHSLGPQCVMPAPTFQSNQLPAAQPAGLQVGRAQASFSAPSAGVDVIAVQDVSSGRGGGSEPRAAGAAGLGFSPAGALGHGHSVGDTGSPPGAVPHAAAGMVGMHAGPATATADAAGSSFGTSLPLRLSHAAPYASHIVGHAPPAVLQSLAPLKVGQGMPASFPSIATLLGGYWQGAPVPAQQLMTRSFPVATASTTPRASAPGAAAIPLFAVQQALPGVASVLPSNFCFHRSTSSKTCRLQKVLSERL